MSEPVYLVQEQHGDSWWIVHRDHLLFPVAKCFREDSARLVAAALNATEQAAKRDELLEKAAKMYREGEEDYYGGCVVPRGESDEWLAEYTALTTETNDGK